MALAVPAMAQNVLFAEGFANAGELLGTGSVNLSNWRRVTLQ